MVVAFLAGTALAAGSFAVGTQFADARAGVSDGVVTPVSLSNPASSESADATPVPAIPLSAQPAATVAQMLGPSVVQIETDSGLGSGVVYSDGLIITNNHVIERATQIQIRTSDGRAFDAELLGTDPRNDIAVLDVGAGTGLPVAELGHDADLAVGELAIAIGSPFQLQQTVTSGIVSALNRPVPNNGGGITAMIQTDAPINPGNSGGALANAAGQVIGINTSIRTDGTSNSNVGIGFAVPIGTAANVADRIISGQSLDVGVLGVQGSNGPDDDIGVVVGEVSGDGAAAEAGLVTGDRVIAVNGAPITDFAELVGLVQSHFRGDVVELTIQRNGQPTVISAVLD